MGIVDQMEFFLSEIPNESTLNKWSSDNQVFIDVRAPIEFQQGHIPNSINAPILNDEERTQVGLTYKKKGNEAAVRLGHEIVSGFNRQKKIEIWKSILQEHPNAILTCFRGGQRSRITQSWLKNEGFERPLIKGGYKSVRQAFINKINQVSLDYPFLLVSGPTGAGKTAFLSEVNKFWPAVHLEKYAEHRGSAFGGFGRVQPPQAIFENRLGYDLFKIERTLLEDRLPLIMEDESRMIGRSVIPENFFLKLRESPIVWLDTPLEKRVVHTFEEYILKADVSEALFERYKKSLFNIQRRLGGAQYKEILSIFESCEASWKSRGELEENKVWIESLLVHYYDPLYFGSLEKRKPVVLFKASNHQEALNFLGQKSKYKETAVKTKAKKT